MTKGSVGFAASQRDGTKFVSNESVLRQERGRTTFRILLDEPSNCSLFIARNVDASGARSTCDIFRIAYLQIADIDRAELKRLRAARHSYWHYRFDLGDGVIIEPSLAGIMDFHALNQRVLFDLLQNDFGGVVGKRVLDVACSSGWHSRGLARLGASVTAIDIDKSQIDQAIMAQSYSEDARERSVLFKHCDLFDYASDPADLIFCSGLFYHLRDLVGGAKKIFDLSKSGAVIHSHIAPGDGDRMELADANKFIYCFQGEFSFVPTASMLAKILCYVGFSEVRVFRPMDVLPAHNFSSLLPHYSDALKNGTAYYVARKR